VNALHRIIGLLRPHRRRLSLAVLLTILACLLNSPVPPLVRALLEDGLPAVAGHALALLGVNALQARVGLAATGITGEIGLAVVRELRQAHLRQAVVIVPPQAVLFERTLRSNSLYTAPASSAASIHRVLEALDLESLVASLPQGLETRVGDRGHSLSGGQRQRLALARALLAQPQVLLLDDCTSALDAETEARVRAALDDLLPRRTMIIVAHKADAVRNANWIVVLEEGKIVEQGRPEKIFTQSPTPSVVDVTGRERMPCSRVLSLAQSMPEKLTLVSAYVLFDA
jgi:ABC-type protease/lipase transport system fused ATPase/permease subunit